MFWDSIFHPEYFNGNNAGSIQQDVIADSGESGNKHGYSVDSTMFPDDEAAGVLRNGEHITNPTAHNINDYINEVPIIWEVKI